jgi:hypothetical protein
MDIGNIVGEKFESISKNDMLAGTIDKIKGLGSELIKEAGEGGAEVFEGYDDNFVIKTSPTPVTICIGNYFKHDDMVIDGVKFNMSKEMTENGPLYIDVDLSISSRRVVDNIDYVGMFIPNTGSRVINVGTSLNTTGI